MSRDIKTRVGDYYRAVDQRQMAVDQQEVTDRALWAASQSSRVGRRRGPLLALVAVVVVLLSIGGLTWLLRPIDISDTADLAAPTDPDIGMRIDQMLDDFLASAYKYDEDAFAALITDDFVGYRIDRSGTIETYERVFPSTVYWPERLGDPIVIGEGPWVVSQAVEVDWQVDRPGPAPFRPVQGVFTWTIVDDGGTLRIANVVEVMVDSERIKDSG
jgi:hypothetical protein